MGARAGAGFTRVSCPFYFAHTEDDLIDDLAAGR
jgi:hypothetical protein